MSSGIWLSKGERPLVHMWDALQYLQKVRSGTPVCSSKPSAA